MRSSNRIKPGVDEGSGLVLSGGYFEGTLIGNFEGAGPVEGYPLGNSEGTRVVNKLGIYDGGVPSIAFRVVDRSKLGGDEGSGPVLLDGYCKVARDGKLEDGREYLENSAL